MVGLYILYVFVGVHIEGYIEKFGRIPVPNVWLGSVVHVKVCRIQIYSVSTKYDSSAKPKIHENNCYFFIPIYTSKRRNEITKSIY